MGDATSGLVRLSFNPQLRVEFRGATVTSDAGLLLPRELDERLGLGALIERYLTDPRTGRNSQFPLPDLQPARDGGAVDQGGQRSHSLDAPLLPRLPGQRGALAPRGDRIQSGQSVASAGLAGRHSELVPDEPARA